MTGPDVVYRDGTRLLLNGSPYQFVGFNAFGAASGCEGSPWTRTQLDSYFSALPPASMTRVWAFAGNGAEALDELVASAQLHRQKVILVLENDLPDCTDSGPKDNAWYESGYRRAYLGWVSFLAARYRGSPAIGMYEAVNEPGQAQGEGSLSGATMRDFYATVAATIKTVDPDHLVGAGDNAEYNYADGIDGYQHAISAPGLDVASLHDYEFDYLPDAPALSTHFGPCQQAATMVDKPIVIGELNKSVRTLGPVNRALLVRDSMRRYLASGAAGVLIWNRSMASYDDGEGYLIDADDPLTEMIARWPAD